MATTSSMTESAKQLAYLAGALKAPRITEAAFRLADQARDAGWSFEDYLAAVSVGIVEGEPCLDLCYTEDSTADVDMNVVMTGKGELVEVQGTAEHRSFSRKEMDRLLDLAWKGISEIVDLQKRLVQI